MTHIMTHIQNEPWTNKPDIYAEILERTPSDLVNIRNKIENNQRLSREDGLLLMKSPHLEWITSLANLRRKDLVGDIVYFSNTFYVHPTNLCELSCPMCSFYAKPGWKTAWFDAPNMVEEKIKANLDKTITEIHIVGGLWRDCNLDYYKELFTRIKSIDNTLHIKALTPVEYHFLAELHSIPIEEVFRQMMSWGLGSLPGGGAEILVEEIRKKIAPGKITSQQYLDVHQQAHEIGLRSNITMLFGHIEDEADIVEHLLQVRSLQDKTGGFQTFVPLKYHVENNALGKRKERLKPKEIKRIYSVSRLMLDNIRNLKVLWNYLGFEEAQEILNCGGNDLGSTSLEEKIITMAGGIQVKMTQEVLSNMITAIGRLPKKVHSGYTYGDDDKKA